MLEPGLDQQGNFRPIGCSFDKQYLLDSFGLKYGDAVTVQI
jgi:hypothetical protein